MGKVSDKLSLLVASEPPEREVKLHILMQENLGRDAVTALLKDLSEFATDREAVELLPSSGIVLMSTTLGAVHDLAQLQDVVWIDKGAQADLKDLLD